MLKHSHEKEVKRFMAEDKDDQDVSVYTLMCRGNHQYNQRVVSEEISGELIVLKRPHTDIPAERFAPCHACLGYVQKSDLWRHVKRCPIASEEDRVLDNKILNALSEGFCGSENEEDDVTTEFFNTVVAPMRHSPIRDIITKDRLLLLLGAKLLNNKGKDVNQVAAIRSRLTSLAKLLTCVRKRVGIAALKMEEALKPRYFDAVIASVRELCSWDIGSEHGSPSFKVPSLALKLGHSLKKAAELALSQSIKEERVDDATRIKDYIKLHVNEWGDTVSHAALHTIDKRKQKHGGPSASY